MATIDEIKKRRQGGAGSQGTVSDQSGTGVSLLGRIRQGFANADATSERGGMRPPITNAKVTGLGASLTNPEPSTKPVEIPEPSKASLGEVDQEVKIEPPAPKIEISPSIDTPKIPVVTGETLQREALGSGATQSSVSNTPLAGVIPDYTSQTGDNTYSFTNNNGSGFRSNISTDKVLSNSSLGNIQNAIDFNAKQSTKDMFARDAQNTADSLAKYGNPYSQESLAKEKYQKQLDFEYSKPFLRRGVISDLQDSIAKIDAQSLAVTKEKNDTKLGEDTLAANILMTKDKLAAARTPEDTADIASKTLKNINELKSKGDSSTAKLYGLYKVGTGNKPAGLDALASILPDEEVGQSLGSLQSFKALLSKPEYSFVSMSDKASALKELNQRLGNK